MKDLTVKKHYYLNAVVVVAICVLVKLQAYEQVINLKIKIDW